MPADDPPISFPSCSLPLNRNRCTHSGIEQAVRRRHRRSKTIRLGPDGRVRRGSRRFISSLAQRRTRPAGMIMLAASLVSGCALDRNAHRRRARACGALLMARRAAPPRPSAQRLAGRFRFGGTHPELGSAALDGNLDLGAALARFAQAEAQMTIAGAALLSADQCQPERLA